MNTVNRGIHDIMHAIDNKQFDYLASRTGEDMKADNLFTVMRWTSAIRGPNAAAMLINVNECANFQFSEISDHPDLQFRLLAAAGLGSPQKHEWLVPAKKAKSLPTKLQAFILEQFPNINDEEVEIIIRQFDQVSFLEFINSCGIEKVREKELKDAFKKAEEARSK